MPRITLSYTATLSDDSPLPAWLSFDALTQTFSGTPTNSDLGTISIKVTADDGTSTVNDVFDLTVTNTNDPPVIGGVNSATLTEDVDPDLDNLLEANDALTISDPDVGEVQLPAGDDRRDLRQPDHRCRGQLELRSGQYPASIQQIDAGESVTDVVTVSTADGTTHDITITIDGAEDAAGDRWRDHGHVTEDGIRHFTVPANTFRRRRCLRHADATPRRCPMTARCRPGADLRCRWPRPSAVHRPTVTWARSASRSPTDDGTSTVNDIFDLTVTNTNDPPVIGGVDTATLTEDVDPDLDNLLEANDALTIADPDVGESVFQAATIVGTYGSLTIDAAGNWSYEADNTQLASSRSMPARA